MSALIVIDVQNDFCPGGELAVPGGDQVVSTINHLRHHFDRVIFTQDWHPPNHMSFAVNHPGKKPGDVIQYKGMQQTLWPVHCVQGSWGAQFHKNLNIQPQDMIFKKGSDPEIDSYSAFYDNGHKKNTGLGEYLRRLGVREVTLCGLATDYCVKYSVLDALNEDFIVNVITDACRGVNLSPKDADNAIEEMRSHGARIATLGKK